MIVGQEGAICLGAPASGQRSDFTEAVANACASADLLLTLVSLDPSLLSYSAAWANANEFRRFRHRFAI